MSFLLRPLTLYAESILVRLALRIPQGTFVSLAEGLAAEGGDATRGSGEVVEYLFIPLPIPGDVVELAAPVRLSAIEAERIPSILGERDIGPALFALAGYALRHPYHILCALWARNPQPATTPAPGHPSACGRVFPGLGVGGVQASKES